MASIQTWMNWFKAAHGEVYDYSKFTTTKSTELRTIICRIHGEFQQNPYNHAKGHGCYQCAKIVRGGKKRKSHDEFISEVSKLYGDLVSFEKTQYVTSLVKSMVISLPLHITLEGENLVATYALVIIGGNTPLNNSSLRKQPSSGLKDHVNQLLTRLEKYMEIGMNMT